MRFIQSIVTNYGDAMTHIGLHRQPVLMEFQRFAQADIQQHKVLGVWIGPRQKRLAEHLKDACGQAVQATGCRGWNTELMIELGKPLFEIRRLKIEQRWRLTVHIA